MDVELLHEVCPMRIDRAETQTEDVGDLPVRVSLCDELENLDLPFREFLIHRPVLYPRVPLLIVRPFDEAVGDDAGNSRAEKTLAREGRPNGFEDLLLPRIFQQVGTCPCPQDLISIFFVLVDGEDNNLDVGMLLLDLPRCLNPVEDRHGNIQDGDVGPVLINKADGFLAICCFRDNGEFGPAPEEHPQPASHYVVIVSDQDSDLLHPCAPLLVVS